MDSFPAIEMKLAMPDFHEKLKPYLSDLPGGLT